MSEAADTQGLICPHCGGGQNGVKDSRPNPIGIRRRHCCALCGGRFTTQEIVVTEGVAMVVQNNGRAAPLCEPLEPYLKRIEAGMADKFAAGIALFFTNFIKAEEL